MVCNHRFHVSYLTNEFTMKTTNRQEVIFYSHGAYLYPVEGRCPTRFLQTKKERNVISKDWFHMYSFKIYISSMRSTKAQEILYNQTTTRVFSLWTKLRRNLTFPPSRKRKLTMKGTNILDHCKLRRFSFHI